MSEIQGIGRFKFHGDKLAEFMRLSAQATEIVRLATGLVSSDLLDEPSAELRAALADSPVRLFTPYLSM